MIGLCSSSRQRALSRTRRLQRTNLRRHIFQISRASQYPIIPRQFLVSPAVTSQNPREQALHAPADLGRLRNGGRVHGGQVLERTQSGPIPILHESRALIRSTSLPTHMLGTAGRYSASTPFSHLRSAGSDMQGLPHVGSSGSFMTHADATDSGRSGPSSRSGGSVSLSHLLNPIVGNNGEVGKVNTVAE